MLPTPDSTRREWSLRACVRDFEPTLRVTGGEHRDSPPQGPLLTWWLGSSGMRGAELGFSSFGLWALPPAGSIDFVVEWLFGQIDPNIAELDGTAIADTASRPSHYWPGSQQENQQ